MSDLVARLRATEDWDDRPWWWDAPEKTFGDDSPASLIAEAADLIAELEAIVRRLATISVAGAYRVDQLVELREDARQWVAEHTDRGIDVSDPVAEVQAKEATDG